MKPVTAIMLEDLSRSPQGQNMNYQKSSKVKHVFFIALAFVRSWSRCFKIEGHVSCIEKSYLIAIVALIQHTVH